MNSPSLRRVLSFTRFLIFVLAFFMQVTVKAWDVDFSRRDKDLQQGVSPGVVAEEKTASNPITSFLDATGPSQEIVIMNTDQGFVPETVRLRKGGNYVIHVVNVNEKQKNVSFILDAFSEHHGIFYGQPKTFSMTPKTEGIYSFQCPESAKQGHIVVFSDDRKPASN